MNSFYLKITNNSDRIALLALFILFVSFITLTGQSRQGMPRVKILLMERQLSEIKKNIYIDSRDITRFDQLYREYIKELFDLNARYNGLVPLDSDFGQFTDNQTEEIFIMQTEKSKILLLIREKYFYEFKSIIKPKEIMKLYSIERQILRQVQQEMRNRTGQTSPTD